VFPTAERNGSFIGTAREEQALRISIHPALSLCK